jgi:hypothetical protein
MVCFEDCDRFDLEDEVEERVRELLALIEESFDELDTSTLCDEEDFLLEVEVVGC